MSDYLDKIFAEVCVDDRITDGVFDMSNNSHMEVLRETLMDNYQVNLNDAKVIHNKMVEGKYPERQAYNKDGLLVTFPTPQHKQKAISRGTHFEKDPTAGTPNVFGGGQQPQGQEQPQGQPPAAAGGGGAPSATPSATPSPSPEGDSQQNIFPTGQEQPEKAPQGQGAPSSQLPASDTPQEPKAPSGGGGASAPSALPASDVQPTPTTVQQGGQTLAVEPQGNDKNSATVPAPPPNFSTPKSPEQRAAEAEVVKGIMNTDDTSVDTRYSLSEQWARVEEFCAEKGYRGALKVVQGMKSIHSIMEDMSKRK